MKNTTKKWPMVTSSDERTMSVPGVDTETILAYGDQLERS